MNRSIPSKGLPLAILLVCTLAACREITVFADPDTREEADLTFVRVDPAAPPLDALEASFWAVQGEDREVLISYDAPGYADGKCLLFRVPADAVMEGVAPGDSVRVTVRVLDPNFFRFALEPEGLTFHPDHPAWMEIRYRWADPDMDGDGDVDARDRLLTETFGVWEKDGPGASWSRMHSALRLRDALEFHSPTLRFTQYALATD